MTLAQVVDRGLLGRPLRLIAAVLLAVSPCVGQQGAPTEGAANASPRQPGEVIDRVVAVVNQDPVLDSDLDEERRFVSFQPITDPTGSFSRQRALERLIDRTLILQQAKIQAQPPVSDSKLDAELLQLRKDLPACRQYQCQTDAGWKRYVSDHGFTMAELRERWRQRMEVLDFIELRFRGGIQISQAEIDSYYTKSLLPEYRKQGVVAPKVDAISDRIREVLLEQQVSSLLSDWLKSLRAQGSIRIMSADDTLPEEGVVEP